jgi:hypothetical protein
VLPIISDSVASKSLIYLITVFYRHRSFSYHNRQCLPEIYTFATQLFTNFIPNHHMVKQNILYMEATGGKIIYT